MSTDPPERDLAEELAAWAAATDPATEPIEPGDVRGASRPTAAPTAGGHRWLAAAALVAVVAVTGAVIAGLARDDGSRDEAVASGDHPDPTTAPGGGVATQVVLVDHLGPEVTLRWAPACGPEDVCPLTFVPAQDVGTTMLIHDGRTPADRPLEPTFVAHACDGPACLAPETDAEPAGEEVGSCRPGRVTEPGRVVVTVAPTDDGIACTLAEVDALPALDLPPAFTTREPGIGCGIGAVDAGMLIGPSDPLAAAESIRCLLDALTTGAAEITELATSEIEPNDDSTSVWARVLVEPVDDLPVEVFRNHGGAGGGRWTLQRCRSIGPAQEDPVLPELLGCTDPDELSLDHPPFPEGGPSASTPDQLAGTVDVVLAARDLPIGEEGTIHRWALFVGGDEVRSGNLGHDDVVLVAVDLVRSSDAVEVTWERYECEGTCPSVGPDGRPLDERIRASTPPCRTTVPAGRNVVVDLAVEGPEPRPTCEARAVGTLPALTVPPTWSLREPLGESCGTDAAAGLPDPLYPGAPSPSRQPRRCVVDTWEAGGSVELATVLGGGRPVVVRVDDGEVTLVRPSRDGSDWTTQSCAGLAILDQPPWAEATGCGDEEPLPLRR